MKKLDLKHLSFFFMIVGFLIFFYPGLLGYLSETPDFSRGEKSTVGAVFLMGGIILYGTARRNE